MKVIFLFVVVPAKGCCRAAVDALVQIIDFDRQAS